MISKCELHRGGLYLASLFLCGGGGGGMSRELGPLNWRERGSVHTACAKRRDTFKSHYIVIVILEQVRMAKICLMVHKRR
jgi:hypothetical protein